MRLSPNPRLGYTPVPNSDNRNNFGFRDDNWNPTDDRDKYRIVIIGDSVTDGHPDWNGPYTNNYAHVLESELNQKGHNVVVYNAGVSSYNTLMEVELLKTLKDELKPDMVILAYVLNDSFKEYPYPLFSLLEKAVETRQWQTGFSSFLFTHSDLYRFCYSFLSTDSDIEDRLQQAGEYAILYQDTVSQSLKELSDLSRQDSFQTLVLIFPFLKDKQNNEINLLHEYPYEYLHTQAIQRASQADLPAIDLREQIHSCREKNGAIHADTIHLNAVGNRCIGEYLASELIARDLIP
ncbi:MAG: SGNH/GDSL hydrolase family protein [Leptospiraceae bacterium]|nr:SGNH/GDSL hydrolase family protein [Leptospiraceae bacterium]